MSDATPASTSPADDPRRFVEMKAVFLSHAHLAIVQHCLHAELARVRGQPFYEDAINEVLTAISAQVDE